MGGGGGGIGAVGGLKMPGKRVYVGNLSWDVKWQVVCMFVCVFVFVCVCVCVCVSRVRGQSKLG